MWNDTGLQHDVEDEVRWELSAGVTQIGVKVKGGAVELAGHVDSLWEKCAAERAAWRVAHVNHVTNGIRVVIPFDKQRGDDDIALAAMGSLEWNCLVPETVELQVTEGLVTLSGGVERQQQKEEAERALCTLIGITGIRNDIVIQPRAHPADARF
ncbi:MAG: BON domain-containing protein [Acidobacteria bacterium]|nr:BON domain-containing protein [Acidobacteriota bacterium]